MVFNAKKSEPSSVGCAYYLPNTNTIYEFMTQVSPSEE